MLLYYNILYYIILYYIIFYIFYIQPHAYISYRCVCTLFLCQEQRTNKQEFRLALREERQLLQSMAKDAVLVKPPMETVGKLEGKMVTGTNRNMG